MPSAVLQLWDRLAPLSLRELVDALRHRHWREALFLASVWLKGLDGVVQVVLGCMLLSVSPAAIVHIVQSMTRDALLENPQNGMALGLLRAAWGLSTGSVRFIALYLLIHGAVKLGLVWALLKRVLIAYPLSIVVFFGFIAYQLHRYSLTQGPGLLLLTGLDVVVIVLIYLEYRALRSGRA